MNDIPCGHLVIDDSRNVLDANNEAVRLLGTSRESIVGQRFSVLLPPGSRIFFQAHVFPELALKGRVDELYLSIVTAMGELPVLLNAARRGDGGSSVYDIVFLPIYRRSLFERELQVARNRADEATASERRALEEVRTMQAQLTFAERLAVIGTLAAGVAHEVNNPLTYVLANLEALQVMLSDAREPSKEQTAQWLELVGEALDGSERIRNIVGDLKLLSRNETSPQRRVELQRIVQVALRLSSPSLKPHVDVRVDVRHPGIAVLGDEGRLVQVLVNLLINAVQALPESRPESNRITVVVDQRGQNRAIVEVTDNGPGIPPEVRERIFDPFFTTKPRETGTGLGLAVCHGIITALGGTIELATEEGRGTTFRLDLPRCPA